MDGVSIGPGNLAGNGVYAARDFAAGEVVVAFELTPLSREQFRALAAGEQLFVHSYDGQRWLYPAPARWVNHSDEPSCYQDFAGGHDIALRPIKAGEPITIDATQETARELSTFLAAYVDAQQRKDLRELGELMSPDVELWKGGRVVRGAEGVASALAADAALSVLNVEWQVGTGRWEALGSAEVVGEEASGHLSLFLRVREGNWQVTYHHRG